MTIQLWLPEYQKLVEESIRHFFAERYRESVGIEKTYEEALRYAVEGGGKRLRPILAMVAYEYFAGVGTDYWSTEGGKKLLTSIIGIEFMHCYTLVHDDLPCMDNDELRRGKPTVWKVYGEAMALLVGDTLQTISFELLALSGDPRLLYELARSLGDLGVARGQVRDSFLRHDALTESDLLRIHDEKTGVFIAAALVIGAILGGGDMGNQNQMKELGMLLGRAFQIRDDILDALGSVDAVGKKTGKDIELGKGIVALIGIEESKNLLKSLEYEMLGITQELRDNRFSQIADFVITREN